MLINSRIVFKFTKVNVKMLIEYPIYRQNSFHTSITYSSSRETHLPGFEPGELPLQARYQPSHPSLLYMYGPLLIHFFSKASSGSSSKPLPSLNRLVQPGKKQRKVFKCAKCAKMFLSIDHLQKHMQVCYDLCPR